MTGKPFLTQKFVSTLVTIQWNSYTQGAVQIRVSLTVEKLEFFFYSVSDHLSKKLGQWRYLHAWTTCDGFVFHLEGMKIIIDYL